MYTGFYYGMNALFHNKLKIKFVFFYFSQDTSDKLVRFHLIGAMDVHTYK